MQMLKLKSPVPKLPSAAATVRFCCFNIVKILPFIIVKPAHLSGFLHNLIAAQLLTMKIRD
jgi:hypothetical protein